MTQDQDSKKKYLREEYTARINLVIDYITRNMDKDLSLKMLAEVANFSPFHFHRIFGAMVGENLNQFIQRIRVEKAAAQLMYNPKKSITEIALDCGFSSSATFARAFKEAFGVSASEWRSGEYFNHRKNGKTDSKYGKDLDASSYYINDITEKNWRRIKMDKHLAQIEVREMPEFNVAYIRHIGPYKGDSKLFDNLFGRLMNWAGPRGLIRFPETLVLTVYHDDPEITDDNKLRIDACITVPEDTPAQGEIGKMTIPGGKFAVGRFEITSEEFQEAWDTIFSHWLPESGYQPDDRPSFEIYHNNHMEHPEKKFIVDICVPVRPL